MNNQRNDKWLDKELTKILCSEKLKPDFEQWKQKHPNSVENLKSQVQGNSIPKSQINIRKIIIINPITKFAAAILIISSFVACFVLS